MPLPCHGAICKGCTKHVDKGIKGGEPHDQQERLVQKFRQAGDDTFPWELIEREIARAEGEKRELHAAIVDLDRRITDQLAAIDHLGVVADYCSRVQANLGDPSFDTKRLALTALAVEVRANGTSPESWEVRGSIPLSLVVASRSYFTNGTQRIIVGN